MKESLTLQEVFEDCLQIVDMEQSDAVVLGLKLAEEYGEFAEATLMESGYLKHKVLKEDSFGEAADIINVMLAVLKKLHPGMSDAEILAHLVVAIDRKRAKYQSILEAQPR